jgi:adenylate cyclase
MRPIEHVVVVPCEASRVDVWRSFANTQLMNMFIGSHPLDVARVEDKESATRFVISTKVAGIPLRYREEPWQWTEARFWQLRRDMESGPAKTFSIRYDLVDREGGGTIVTIRATVVPRHFLFWPIVWFVSRNEIRRVGKFVEAVDASVTTHTPIRPTRADGDPQRADQCLSSLRKRYDAGLLDKLRDHVCNGPDFEVLRIRPFELARTWGRKRDEVVRLCLDAVSAGLLDLAWCIICPSCQTVSEKLPSLRELEEVGHCHACDLRFGMDLVRSVEATFSPHPAIRVVEARPFCIAGPMLMPHIISQGLAYPESPAVLDVSSEPGRYRLFARGGKTAIVDVESDKPARAEVALGDAKDESSSGFDKAEIDVAPGGRIEVSNLHHEPCHVKLERTEWNFDALTALHVSAFPEFRAQFGGEALRPGLALKIGKAAIYFSDLCGSTALYSKVGDAAAFGIVTDCLDYGREIVARHGGTVVKTMGDAVMAAFTDVEAAMRAGADSVLEWERFQEEHPLARELDIKVGVAAGPCTVVTANGVLDYFGQTVNSAARIQHLAGGREFVVPEDLVREPPAGLEIAERFSTHVKGIVEALSLVRLGIATKHLPAAAARGGEVKQGADAP